MSRLVLGTRGSDLARAQTRLVEEALRASGASLEIAVEIIRTSGDERAGRSAEAIDRHAGRKGLFTAEIERALRAGQIDVAIHSAKDLPSEPSPGLEICAVLPRAAVEDVLIARETAELARLPRAATVATGSVRRQHQLRALRPDLHVVDLRGNVPTRLRKLAANPWEAIILARAGLERLGLAIENGPLRFEEHEFVSAILPCADFLPAAGQGIVALQIRAEDETARALLAPLNHAASALSLRAEREFLRRLQGDCGTPVGVLATVENENMTMRAQLFVEGHDQPRRAEVRGPLAPEALAQQLWEQIHVG